LRREITFVCLQNQKTTNGSWRGTGGEAWKTFEEIAQRRLERNVQVDEQNRTAQNGQNQTQKIAEEKAALKIN